MTDRETFWQRLDGVNAGMLGAAPDWRLVPMSHYADPEEGALWFITAAGTDLFESVKDNPQEAAYVVASSGDKIYAHIDGVLESSSDAAKLDEIWNAIASSWFEDGKRDPDLRLIKLSIAKAEVWITGGGLGFLFEVAKSKLTGSKPDMGEHFSVTF